MFLSCHVRILECIHTLQLSVRLQTKWLWVRVPFSHLSILLLKSLRPDFYCFILKNEIYLFEAIQSNLLNFLYDNMKLYKAYFVFVLVRALNA